MRVRPVIIVVFAVFLSAFIFPALVLDAAMVPTRDIRSRVQIKPLKLGPKKPADIDLLVKVRWLYCDDDGDNYAMPYPICRRYIDAGCVEGNSFFNEITDLYYGNNDADDHRPEHDRCELLVSGPDRSSSILGYNDCQDDNSRKYNGFNASAFQYEHFDAFKDVDGDNFGGVSDPLVRLGCNPVLEGYADNDADCNDLDPNIYPGATEVADSADNNCDGVIDEGFTTDSDSDGFTVVVDCDDLNAAIHPNCSVLGANAPQGCVDVEEDCFNGIDDNCDGNIDFADSGCVPGQGSLVDNDGDLFPAQVDCDDNDPLTHPSCSVFQGNPPEGCTEPIELESCTEVVDRNCDGIHYANTYPCALCMKGVCDPSTDCDQTWQAMFVEGNGFKYERPIDCFGCELKSGAGSIDPLISNKIRVRASVNDPWIDYNVDLTNYETHLPSNLPANLPIYFEGMSDQGAPPDTPVVHSLGDFAKMNPDYNFTNLPTVADYQNMSIPQIEAVRNSALKVSMCTPQTVPAGPQGSSCDYAAFGGAHSGYVSDMCAGQPQYLIDCLKNLTLVERFCEDSRTPRIRVAVINCANVGLNVAGLNKVGFCWQGECTERFGAQVEDVCEHGRSYYNVCSQSQVGACVDRSIGSCNQPGSEQNCPIHPQSSGQPNPCPSSNDPCN